MQQLLNSVEVLTIAIFLLEQTGNVPQNCMMD